MRTVFGPTGKFFAILVAGLLIACLGPVSAAPLLSGDVALAGGWTGFPTQTGPGGQHAESLVALCGLTFAPPRLGGCTLTCRVRHPFYNDRFGYWRSKREFNAELDAPIGHGGTTCFATYTRGYSGRTNDYCLAGVRQRF